jgi:hypothetical protein
MTPTSRDADGHCLQEIESRISKAPTKNEALQRAIKAVELYMQAIKVAADNHDRTHLKTKCQMLLKRAESLKKADTWQPTTSPTGALKGPVSTRMLTTKEQIILLEGSKLNGFIFQPWKSDPDPEEFHLRNGEELFTYENSSRIARYVLTSHRDATELGLSKRQLKIFDGWKRPNELFPLLSGGATEGPTMTRNLTIDLVQDVATDCSVVASLCALASRAERGHAKVCSKHVPVSPV